MIENQAREANAYRLIAPGTVEEKIWELQQSKAKTIADVLGEEGLRVLILSCFPILANQCSRHFLRNEEVGIII